MLCMSNFAEMMTLICNVDVKLRRRVLSKVLKNKRNPTSLFQIDEDYIAVGTTEGMMEIWYLTDDTMVTCQEVHSESTLGVSQIVELQDPSYLITGDKTKLGERYILTAAFDKSEFKIWKLNGHEFVFHIRISTSHQGIKHAL